MRNNAAYLPESPIVYIILPKSIQNRASFTIFSLKRDCRHLQKTVSENGYHSRRHKNVISATACIPDGIYKFVTFLYKLGYLMPVSNGLPEYLQICEPGFEAPQR